MSNHTIEKVLWDLVNQPALAERFRSDIESLLNGYPLAPTERELVKSMDVNGLIALRVNPMLLMRACQFIQAEEKRFQTPQ